MSSRKIKKFLKEHDIPPYSYFFLPYKYEIWRLKSGMFWRGKTKKEFHP